MVLLKEIIKMKRELQQDEYIHIVLPYDHGCYIKRDDKLMPEWYHKYIVVERKNQKRTLIPLKKIIMVVVDKEEQKYE